MVATKNGKRTRSKRNSRKATSSTTRTFTTLFVLLAAVSLQNALTEIPVGNMHSVITLQNSTFANSKSSLNVEKYQSIFMSLKFE